MREALRILAVDDESPMRDLLATILAIPGHHVSVARSTEEACSAMAGSPPDVVVTDLVMPGLGGLELIRWLRARQEPCWIVAISGGSVFDGVDGLTAAIKAGADRTLRKPFTVTELLEAIEMPARR